MVKIIGAVFPVPHENIKRILSKKSDVFAKFGRFLHLSKGQKLLFYDSSVHAVVGEATIEEVAYADPCEVWKQFGERLFLTKTEFDKYLTETPLGSRNLEGKTMTVCVLSMPNRYTQPKKLRRKMNMIGHYLRG